MWRCHPWTASTHDFLNTLLLPRNEGPYGDPTGGVGRTSFVTFWLRNKVRTRLVAVVDDLWYATHGCAWRCEVFVVL